MHLCRCLNLTARDKTISLYLHIPFCDKKCYYCDFKSFAKTSEKLREDYVAALCQEIENYSSLAEGKEVVTIYFGGGTPSVLSPERFEKIVLGIKDNYVLSDELEFTVEVNPESVSLEKVLSYKDMGVNRISIGLQSSDDKLLKEIGRLHTYEKFLRVYEMFRQNGFDNISVDVISNLIGQSVDSHRDTLEKIIKLQPEHVSSYSLMIEEGSMYYSMKKAGKLNYTDDFDRAMYDMTGEMLKKSGYNHYEISNYCLDDKYSRHNMRYWDLSEYKGFGISASSFVDKKRTKNTLKIKDYIASRGNVDEISELEYELDDKLAVEEMLFLGLRKLAGINIEEIYSLLDDELKKELDENIAREIKKGYLEFDGKILKLSKKGIDFSNDCFSGLLFD